MKKLVFILLFLIYPLPSLSFPSRPLDMDTFLQESIKPYNWIDEAAEDLMGDTVLIPEEGMMFIYNDGVLEQTAVFADLSIEPTDTIFFGGGEEPVGKLTWENGKMEFEGNMDESARIFFDSYLKGMIDEYIEERLKECKGK